MAQQENSGAGSSRSWVPFVLIASVGVLVYLNSFRGQFVFDDAQLAKDPFIRTLWPPWHSMLSATTINRPLVGFSFAINYAISGAELWSYHLFNLIVHVLAATTLFGVARRTFMTPRLAGRFGKPSTGLALSIALLWMVHPLQTQSVTYIIQRAEAMAGFFYLLTLYCAIRGLQTNSPWRWYFAGILSCAAGMASKPVMVSAPFIVLAWDLIFCSSSLKETLRRRAGFYSGLAATWLIVAATASASLPQSESAGFNLRDITPWSYFRSQFAVIFHYLKLSFWPYGLCLDYGWRPEKSVARIVPYAIGIAVLGLAAVVSLKRRPEAGFVGLFFFLILAPTSSVLPLLDLVVEHRMYLPLAAVVAISVTAAYSAIAWFRPVLEKRGGKIPSWIFVGAIAIVVAWLGSLTIERNVFYESRLIMWADVVNKQPGNPRGHNNLGLYLAERGEYDEAVAQLKQALQQSPGFPEANNNMGMALVNSGHPEDAAHYFVRALDLRPTLRTANYNLGQVRASQGKWEDAATLFRRELDLDPENIDAYRQLCLALEQLERFAEAAAAYREAIRLSPLAWDLKCRLALLISDPAAGKLRNLNQAVELVDEAARLTQRKGPRVLDILASVYSSAGRFDEAIAAAQEALVLANAQGRQQLVDQINVRLVKYRAHQPARP